jgi:hypothetical protein
LGFTNILSQIIAIEDIVPGTWVQVADAPVKPLVHELSSHGLSIKETTDVEGTIGRADLVATVYSNSLELSVCNGAPEKIVNDTSVVTRAVSSLARKRIERFPETDLHQLLKSTTDRTVIRFPTIAPQQVVDAVSRGDQVGAGVTRWEFRNRVLNANVPVGRWLNSPVRELNLKLADIVRAGTSRAYCAHVIEAELEWHDLRSIN